MCVCINDVFVLMMCMCVLVMCMCVLMMCMCVHVDVHMCIHMCAHVYTWAHVYTHVCIACVSTLVYFTPHSTSLVHFSCLQAFDTLCRAILMKVRVSTNP